MLQIIARYSRIAPHAARDPDWLHDGWRIQLHKDGSLVRLYQVVPFSLLMRLHRARGRSAMPHRTSPSRTNLHPN